MNNDKYDILPSVKSVMENAKHVKINKDKIAETAGLLKPELLKQHDKNHWMSIDDLGLGDLTAENKILFMLIAESLNFCFWEKPKWKVEYNGKLHSGTFGLLYALAKTVQSDPAFLNLDKINDLSIEDLDEILKGSRSIPLLQERFAILRQLVGEIQRVGSLYNLFIEAETDQELLQIIVDNFQNFRDISVYDGKEVYFFKRATLLVEDLYQNIPEIKEKIKTTDGLFGCADYKVPQVLRQLGVLEYSDELAQIVDSEQELKHDSEMEIEIRAGMVYATELIKEKLKADGVDASASEIDSAMWLLSKSPDYKVKPYHLTKTIYY